MKTFCHKLHNESWLSVYNADGSDNAYDTFTNTIMAVCDESLPIARVKSNKQFVDKPWITIKLKTHSKNKKLCSFQTVHHI